MIRAFALLAFFATALSCGTNPPRCQPSNCAGCCTREGECLGATKQSVGACGSAGEACKGCLGGQVCSAQGRCIADPSGAGGGSSAVGGGAASCGEEDSTCCANQTCTLGLTCSRGFCVRCGTTGQPCCAGSLCSGSNVCRAGRCEFPTAAGGGAASTGGGSASTGGGSASTGGGSSSTGGGSTSTGGGGSTGGGSGGGASGGTEPVGAACSFGSDCAEGTCLTAGFPGGYCSKSCTSSANCPIGSHCGRNPSGGGNVCLASCPMAGGLSTCRTGYVCDRGNTSLLNVPVCFPRCTGLGQCSGASACDSRGFCCGTAPHVCCDGTTCVSGFSCSAGSCVVSAAGGGSAGTGGGTSGTGGGASGTGGGTSGTGGGTSGTGGGISGTGGGTSGTGGGTTSGQPVGGTCSTDSQCARSGSLLTYCNPNWSTAVPEFTGGYCSHRCTSSGSDPCPSGSFCARYVVPGIPYCLKSCDWTQPTPQNGCRTGYVCDKNLSNTPVNSGCFPRCSAGDCGGLTCDTSTGYCCGGTGYKCCSAATGQAPCAGGSCGADGWCQ